MKSVEKWGASTDEAVELALAELNLSRDDIEIEVLEEPSKGFLGIGSKLAKVRVSEKEKQASDTGAVCKEMKEKPENSSTPRKNEKDVEISEDRLFSVGSIPVAPLPCRCKQRSRHQPFRHTG